MVKAEEQIQMTSTGTPKGIHFLMGSFFISLSIDFSMPFSSISCAEYFEIISIKIFAVFAEINNLGKLSYVIT